MRGKTGWFSGIRRETPLSGCRAVIGPASSLGGVLDQRKDMVGEGECLGEEDTNQKIGVAVVRVGKVGIEGKMPRD